MSSCWGRASRRSRRVPSEPRCHASGGRPFRRRLDRRSRFEHREGEGSGRSSAARAALETGMMFALLRCGHRWRAAFPHVAGDRPPLERSESRPRVLASTPLFKRLPCAGDRDGPPRIGHRLWRSQIDVVGLKGKRPVPGSTALIPVAIHQPWPLNPARDEAKLLRSA